MLQLILSQDKEQTERQIKALEWQLSIETNPKDRDIFKQSLEALKRRLQDL